MARTRRHVLATAGSVGVTALAGCSYFASGRPAGTVVFRNRDNVPHRIDVRVVDVGTQTGPGKRVEGDPAVPAAQASLTSSVALDGGASEVSEGVFTEPVYYALAVRVDGINESMTVIYSPAPPAGSDGRVLELFVDDQGGLGWTISTTTSMGPLDSD